MNREKVTFAANLPTIIELDGPGTPQASTNGTEEYRYFLQDERITWVPPAVHQQIEASGPGHVSATFRVTKHQLKARAPITWEVERVPTPRGGNGYSNTPTPHQPAAFRQPTAPPPLASAPRPPQPAAQLAASAPELPITPADRMAQALKDAIDLWRGATNYAPELHYDAGDVRALAATLFIGGEKGGRA